MGGQSHAAAAFPPEKRPGTGGGDTGLDTCRKSRPSLGFDHQAVQLAASRYTDYAIQAITLTLWNIETKSV